MLSLLLLTTAVAAAAAPVGRALGLDPE